jgi:hypothetical protein
MLNPTIAERSVEPETINSLTNSKPAVRADTSLLSAAYHAVHNTIGECVSEQFRVPLRRRSDALEHGSAGDQGPEVGDLGVEPGLGKQVRDTVQAWGNTCSSCWNP